MKRCVLGPRAGALVLLLCSGAMSSRAAAERQEVGLPPAGRLEVLAPHTELVVTGAEGGELELSASSLDGVQVMKRGGVVHVQVAGPPKQPERLELRLPWGHDLLVEARYQEVSVRGVHGDVTVRQASAPVRLADIVGDVDVLNHHDRIAVDGVEGSARCESFGHEVEVANVTGEVWARSAANRVTASGISGERVELSSVSGHVSYRGPLRADGSYELSSHRGVVQLEIPRDSDAAITLVGQLTAVSVSGAAMERTSGDRAEVLLGEGRARVEIHSFEGAVEIRMSPPLTLHR